MAASSASACRTARSPTRRPGAGVHHRPRVRRRQPRGAGLGDNIFYGHGCPKSSAAAARQQGATVFAYRSRILNATAWSSSTPPDERSRSRRSQAAPLPWAVTALFLRQRRARDCGQPEASARGELEITDVNREYSGAGLHVEMLAAASPGSTRGTRRAAPGLDVHPGIEERQGLKVACPKRWPTAWVTSRPTT